MALQEVRVTDVSSFNPKTHGAICTFYKDLASSLISLRSGHVIFVLLARRLIVLFVLFLPLPSNF